MRAPELTLRWLTHEVRLPPSESLQQLIECVVADVVSKSPEVVIVARTGCDLLSVGTRDGKAVLMRDPPWGATPSYVAVQGDETEDGEDSDEELEFRVASGEPLPVPEDWLIDADDALDVLRDYIRFGTFSTIVNWRLL